MKFVKLDHKDPAVTKAREAYRAHFPDAMAGYWTERQEQDLAVWIASRAAALEEAAAECERMRMYPGGRCEAPAHQNIWDAATAIRALTTKPKQEGL